MITIKTQNEIAQMAEGGKILADIIHAMVAGAKPGVTTREINDLARGLCVHHGVKPAFLGYGAKGKEYPAVSCLSVNDAVVHAIPNDRELEAGDVLGIDMGIVYQGWNLDSAVTVEIKDQISKIKNEKTDQLIEVTKAAMMLGIAQAHAGNHVGDISHAVQEYVEKRGFGVVRDLVGHGIGRELHEDPRIPNFGNSGEGPELREGMVICIEPMVTMGDWRVAIAPDGWTYATKDGSLAAHFEHTVAITKDGPVVLT